MSDEILVQRISNQRFKVKWQVRKMMYTHLSIYSKVLYKYRPYELNMLQMLQENNKTEYLCPRFFVTGHESTCTFEFEECWES